MSTSNEIHTIVSDAILRFSSDLPISAAAVASDAMTIIDPEDTSPPLAAYACNMHIRQVARQIMAKNFEREDSGQGELFSGLQERYPRAGPVKEYIPRHVMSAEDYDWNIDRLEHEAVAKQKHADALRVEKAQKLAAGLLAESDSA